MALNNASWRASVIAPLRSGAVGLLFAMSLTQSLPAQRGELPRRIECTVTRVVDGDTLYCRQDSMKVRLLGIDAPEKGQGKYGDRARKALQKLTPLRRKVYLELDVQERDFYGRVLAYVWEKDDYLVNEMMVRGGYAVVYIVPPNVRYADELRDAARAAQEEGVGLWATKAFECAPADFRKHLCQ